MDVQMIRLGVRLQSRAMLDHRGASTWVVVSYEGRVMERVAGCWWMLSRAFCGRMERWRSIFIGVIVRGRRGTIHGCVEHAEEGLRLRVARIPRRIRRLPGPALFVGHGWGCELLRSLLLC